MRKTNFAKHFHILNEPECPAPRYGLFIVDFGKVNVSILIRSVDRRMTEGNAKRQPEAFVRFQPSQFAAFAHLNGLQNTHEAPRRLLLNKSGAVNEIDEGCSRSIHDGDFRRIDFNETIVHAKSRESTHQMFNRRHRRTPDVHGRCHARVVHIHGRSRNIDRRIKVNAAKDNTGIFRCRMKHQTDFAAAVQTDADSGYRLGERALAEHDSIRLSSNTSEC